MSEPAAKRVCQEGKTSAVLGLQWGDEGKGKLVDILAGRVSVVARCAGGNNAGHTVVVDGVKYDFHLLPSGVATPGCMSVIGNGVVVHPPGLFAELAANEARGLSNWQERLLISDRAHVVLDLHQQMDGLKEEARGVGKIGTTRKGIGPAYAAKATRFNSRIGDLVYHFDRFEHSLREQVEHTRLLFPKLEFNLDEQLALYRDYAEKLRPMVCDTITYVHDMLDKGKDVLVEGANAAMLDIDFGTYPYVTSSNCTIGGACTGLGLPPSRIGNVYGVLKAYCTRVGDGGFPTELVDENGNETEQCLELRKIGHEYGVTTGRPRRCGWFDAVAARFAVRINGVTSLCVTKLDCLDHLDEIPVGVGYTLDGKPIDSVPACIDDFNRVKVVYETRPGWKQDITGVRRYEDLPQVAKDYVAYLAELTGVPVQWIGVGPARDATIEIPLA